VALKGKSVPATEQDLRSVRSEYDYNSKKKFTDVLGEASKA
jgi:hypothetical protein